MLERKHQKIAPPKVFIGRMAAHFGFAILLMSMVLTAGVAGYHYFADLGWIDSLLNASMILGGMGPVNVLASDGAKIFASAYALFSGLIFVVAMGIVFAPIMHRVLHLFHIDE